VRYWDSSALVPLVIAESSSPALRRLLEADPDVSTWWATRVECASAVWRRVRELRADQTVAVRALERLRRQAETWAEIPAGVRLRDLAIRLLRVHDLRAGHALQLAAALVASEEQPETLELVTLDERLASAGRREGFVTLSA
jgi:predicted nucleic acid-binding protein